MFLQKFWGIFFGFSGISIWRFTKEFMEVI